MNRPMFPDEELAALDAQRAEEDRRHVVPYWTGTSANMSPAAPIDLGAKAFGGPPPAAPIGPPPAPAPLPTSFQSQLESQFGRPNQGPPVDPVTHAPEWDPAAHPIDPKTVAFAPPGQPAAAVAPISVPPQQLAADDAAFEQAKARGAPKPTATRPSGPGVAKANPDPYGIKAAQAGQVASFDAREEAMRMRSSYEQEKAQAVGAYEAELQVRRKQDAEVALLEQKDADADFNKRMTSLQSQMDGVRAKKIDPTRATRDLGVVSVIGGVIGGIYQGLTKGAENPFIRELDRMIDRDIAIQEKDIDNARHGVADQMNLLGQQRAIFRDSQAAKNAARVLYYEAAEREIAADVSRYDSAIAKANGEEAIQAVQFAKSQLLEHIGKENRALSMQAASQGYARQKEVHALYRDVYDKVLQSTGNPAIAETEARRQVGVVYAPGTVGERSASPARDPISLVPKDQRTEAVKEFQAYANKEKVLVGVNKAFQDWRNTSTVRGGQLDSTRSAISGTIMANIPGIRSDVDFKEIIEPNLPARGDMEDTLRHKENTIRQFVESKTTTPILDAHAPGWRKPGSDELGLKDVK